jgi:hypothetical protein
MKNKNANKPIDTSEKTGVREISCSTFYDSKGRWMKGKEKEIPRYSLSRREKM